MSDIIALFTGYVATRRCGELSVTGGDRKFLELLKRWPEDLLPITVLAPAGGIELLAAEAISAPIDVRAIPELRRAPLIPTYLSRLISMPAYMRSILSARLVYSTADALPCVLPAFFAKLLRPQLRWAICVFHLIPDAAQRPGTYWWNALSYLAQRVALVLARRADLVIVDNRRLVDELRAIGMTQSDMFVCSMGVHQPQAEPAGAPWPTSYDACFLGRVHPAKGALDLLEAWQMVRRTLPAARLAIIGDTAPMGDDLRAHISRLGLQDAVDVLGILPRANIDAVFRMTRIFTLPSHEEGWGIAVAEAMAYGLPAILYRLPAFEDLYTSGAEIVRPFSVEEYAQTVIRILTDDALYARRSAEAKRLASSFSWDESTRTELGTLRTLLAPGYGRAARVTAHEALQTRA